MDQPRDQKKLCVDPKQSEEIPEKKFSALRHELAREIMGKLQKGVEKQSGVAY